MRSDLISFLATLAALIVVFALYIAASALLPHGADEGMRLALATITGALVKDLIVPSGGAVSPKKE